MFQQTPTPQTGGVLTNDAFFGRGCGCVRNGGDTDPKVTWSCDHENRRPVVEPLNPLVFKYESKWISSHGKNI